MNAVIYYSNAGECQRIAQHLANSLAYPLWDILQLENQDFEKLVIVFPVYSQNIPPMLLPIFRRLRAKQVVLLAAYGKMATGNVLQACQKKFHWPIVAAAYIPTKHCYLPSDMPFSQFSRLDFVRDALESPRLISIPRRFQNPLANFLPGTRARLGVRLVKGKNCNHCGLCTALCPNTKCLRCLKCVQLCPRGALSFRLNVFMKLYLRKHKKTSLIIYQ